MDTISLPTYDTIRSRAGSSARSAAAAPSSPPHPAAGSRSSRSASARSPARASAGGPRPERVDVHARRPEPRAVGQRGIVERRPQALRGVAGADQNAGGAREPLARERHEAFRVALDRVLERAAVDLHGVAKAGPREHDGAHHEVVRERRLRRGARRDLADGLDVRAEVAVELGVGQVLERLRVEALVAIRHVHREHPTDRRPVDGAADRLAQNVEAQLAVVPRAHCVHPRESGRVAVLAQQVDLVAERHHRLREAGVVDVAAGAAQQVAVEYEDPHGG